MKGFDPEHREDPFEHPADYTRSHLEPGTQNSARANFLTRLRRWRPDKWTVLLLCALVYLWFRPPAWVTEQQRKLPATTFVRADGTALSAQDLRGKVVLVNFWATWCPYCRHEMPAMDAYYREHQGDGFVVVALSEDENPALAEAYVRKEGYAFPAYVATSEVRTAFGDVTRLPTSFVVDKRGVVRYRIAGQLHQGRLADIVTPLLAE